MSQKNIKILLCLVIITYFYDLVVLLKITVNKSFSCAFGEILFCLFDWELKEEKLFTYICLPLEEHKI